jgi:hypothetical protein
MSNVFLSHSSKDKDFVEKLANDLNKQGVRVWFDKWEIKVGDSIVEKINDGLSKNDYLAIILSPNSVNSNWVKKELNSSLMKQLSKKSVKVLPILYKDCEIPDIIIDLKYADFRFEYISGVKELIEVLKSKSPRTIIKEKNNKKVKQKSIEYVLKEIIRTANFCKRLTESIFYELSIRIFFISIKENQEENYNLKYIKENKIISPLIFEEIDNLLTLFKEDRFSDFINKIDHNSKVLIENIFTNYKVHIKNLIFKTGRSAQYYIEDDILKVKKPVYFLRQDDEDEMNFYSYYKGGIFDVIRYVGALAGVEVYNRLTENFVNNFDMLREDELKKYLVDYYIPTNLEKTKKGKKYYNSYVNILNFLKWHLQNTIYSWEDVEDIYTHTYNPEKYCFEYKKTIRLFIK